MPVFRETWLAQNSTPGPTLPWENVVWIAGTTVGAALLAGVIVVVARSNKALAQPLGLDKSVVRGWMGISLIIALLALASFAFAVNDQSVRGTLIGAVAASAGSVVAFYFASQNATQAQQNILNAAFGTETVPNLSGQTQADATKALGLTSFKLQINQLKLPANDGSTVVSQQPAAGSSAAKGSSVTVDF
ncbi:PASTA domain-containing protein [Kutzneria chonburiensis]|uniref:PASTA domain-containing protein n=1 Tax=Kutzneria chonburiensis TaxID=1483604 RepID=A0ABV6MP33_9PSEU